MTGFGSLFSYELKKLWMRPLLWVVLGSLLFLHLRGMYRNYVGYTGTTPYVIMDENGQRKEVELDTSGSDRRQMEGGRALAGTKIDDAFFRRAQETVPLDKEPYYIDRYFLENDASYYGFYREFPVYLKHNTAAEFYKTRGDQIQGLLSGLDKDSRAYWEAREAEVEKPFVYQPITGVDALEIEVESLGLYVPVLGGAALCDLFAQERRNRMEALLFSTKRGKGLLFWAKALAGMATAAGGVLLLLGALTAEELALYGTGGWTGAIQLDLGYWTSSLALTMGQLVGIEMLIVTVYALLTGLLAAAISALTGSGVAALAATTAVMFLPVLVGPDSSWARFLPERLTNSMNLCGSLFLWSFSGVQLNLYQTGILLYSSLAVALFGLCGLFWLLFWARPVHTGGIQTGGAGGHGGRWLEAGPSRRSGQDFSARRTSPTGRRRFSEREERSGER